MSYKDGRVMLAAWVSPATRGHVREAARASGLTFSAWAERALMRAMAREAEDRKDAEARARGECTTCGYAPCMCDQQ